MSIKATFPAGVNELTVHGLTQWDYGRKLEIHSDDLPAMLEVHFACEGMRDAVVRSCALIDGVAVAAIPDQCLEQTSPVIAWVYLVGETSGATDKTIIMPIIARKQPQAGATVPEVIGDRYTEAVSAMNGLVNEFKEIVGNVAEEVKDEVREGFASGELLAPNAEHARMADYAGTAGSAESATNATNATNDKNGKDISETYLKKSDHKCLRIDKVFQSKYFQKGEEIELCEMPSGFDVGDIWSVSFAIGTSATVETEQFVGVNTGTVSGTITNRTLYMCCNLSRKQGDFNSAGMLDIGRIEITLTRHDGKLYLTPLGRAQFTILSSVITDGTGAGSNVIEHDGSINGYLHHIYIYFKGV